VIICINAIPLFTCGSTKCQSKVWSYTGGRGISLPWSLNLGIGDKENMHFVKDQLRKPGGSEGVFFSLMVHGHVQCLLLSILSAPLFSPPPLDCDDRLWTTKTNRLMIQFHYGNNLHSVRYIGAHLVVYWRLNQPTLVGLFLCMVWKSRCAANLALLALFGPN
jgi:hypothetical protein